MTAPNPIGALVVLLGSIIAACGGSADGDDEAPGALEQALAHARPAFTPGSAPARPLAAAGPHQMNVRGDVRIDAPSGRQELSIERVIRRGPNLSYRVDDHRTWTTPSVHVPAPGAEPPPARVHEDNVTGLFDGNAFAIRRGDGAWIERDVLDGNAERFLEQAYDLDVLVRDGFGAAIRWREIGPGPDRPATVAGLPVTWREASAEPAFRPEALSSEALVALRAHTHDWTRWVMATHRPTRIEGQMATTADGRFVLGAIDIVGVATVDAVEATFSVRVKIDVTKLVESDKFELPSDRLPAARPRPWKMIDDVLGEDLAPVYRPR